MKFVVYGLKEYIYISAWINFKINQRTVSLEIYGPEFNFPLRVNGEYMKFVWEKSFMIGIVALIPGSIFIDPGLN